MRGTGYIYQVVVFLPVTECVINGLLMVDALREIISDKIINLIRYLTIKVRPRLDPVYYSTLSTFDNSNRSSRRVCP